MTDLSHKIFTPKELAERWKMSPRTIYNMVARGELKAFRAGGTLIRITESEVEKWESAGEIIESETSGSEGSAMKARPSGTRAGSGSVTVSEPKAKSHLERRLTHLSEIVSETP